MSYLSKRLLKWFDQHGRHDLPWQHDPSPYRVWVSEIMLQQTQVTTVVPFFKRFIQCFGSVDALASAEIDEVLHQWSGLGYYARARNLHRAANIIVSEYAGQFPSSIEDLIKLPGVGRSTAGAILALAYDQRYPILDGNVKRVLARYHEVYGWPGNSKVLRQLWSHAEYHTPHKRIADYTQAIMDLGATLCVRGKPRCNICPLQNSCGAFAAQTQAQLPNRRKRNPLPLKNVCFLIARTENESTLLYKRPPNGIWGGLWSFPEINANKDVESWCREHSLRQVGELLQHPALTHTFTHFTLAITPLECVVVKNEGSIMDPNRWLWYNIHNPARVGLSKPVQQLLQI